MNNFKFRWRYIYGRFLILLLGAILGYSLLHWLLVIKMGWIDWHETITHWVLPLALPLALVWPLLGKRFKLFNACQTNSNARFNWLMLVHFFVGGTVVAFQYFLGDFAGELRIVQTPEEIARYKPVKYYMVQHHQAGKYHNRREEFLFNPGRKSDHLNYVLVIGVPLYSPGKMPPQPVKIKPIGADTSSIHTEHELIIVGAEVFPVDASITPVWLCWQYKTSISKGYSKRQKENAQTRFYQQSIDTFYHKDLDAFVYLKRPGNNDDRERFMAVLGEPAEAATPLPQLLEPVYEPYENRYEVSLARAILVFAIASLLAFFLIFLPALNEEAVNKFLEEEEAKRNPPATFRGYI